jgi:hypothetical protein
MSFAVVKPVLKVGRTSRRIQRLAFWEGVAAAILVASIFHPSLWSPWLLPAGGLLVLYGLRKAQLFFRMRRAARQTRLEQQFLRQPLDAAHLRECLYRQDHLWRESLVLRALRSILQRPLPAQFAASEKKQRLRRQLRRSLRPLRLMRYNLDWAAYAAALGMGAWLHPSSLNPAVAGATVLVVLLEGGQAVLQWQLRQQHEAMLDTLGDWLLARDFRRTLRAVARSGYTHHPLYQARSWFAGNGAESGESAPTETSAGFVGSKNKSAQG